MENSVVSFDKKDIYTKILNDGIMIASKEDKYIVFTEEALEELIGRYRKLKQEERAKNETNKIKVLAINAHEDVNHLYDNQPYEVHLSMVVNNAKKYSYLIPEKDREDVESACWWHDGIEDTHYTFNDLRKVTNERVATISFAVSNDLGKTRDERAGENYYRRIRNTKYATFVKLCDRLANVEYSKSKGSRMFEVYKKENINFMKKLYDPRYLEMFSDLITLFK